MSKIAVSVEKHTVTRACKRLISVVSHRARELIGGHVTRENNICSGSVATCIFI
jgi:hypothetical protein